MKKQYIVPLSECMEVKPGFLLAVSLTQVDGTAGEAAEVRMRGNGETEISDDELDVIAADQKSPTFGSLWN